MYAACGIRSLPVVMSLMCMSFFLERVVDSRFVDSLILLYGAFNCHPVYLLGDYLMHPVRLYQHLSLPQTSKARCASISTTRLQRWLSCPDSKPAAGCVSAFLLWGTWSNVPSPVPIWRARESVSQCEREEESWAWSEPKGRPTRYTFNTSLSFYTPPAFHRTVTVLLPHPAVCRRRRLERRGRLRTARPPIAQGSSLRDPLSRATTTRREANRCTIIALSFIPRPPAVTRPDVLILTTTLAASWKALDHLAHRRSYQEGGTTCTCQQTACTPQLPPRRSAALIAKTHTHAQASQTPATLPRHRPSCRYPFFAQLSYPNRPPSSCDQHPLQKARALTTPTVYCLNNANLTPRDTLEITKAYSNPAPVNPSALRH